MRLFTIILLSLLLMACTATKDNRYLDTSALEHPPQLIIESSAIKDISSEPAKPLHRGLGKNRVSLNSNQPPAIILKQSPKLAWHTVEQALRQNLIKIIDREADKGRYYVLYKTNSLFDSKRETLTYIIALSETATDTAIKVSKLTEFEHSGSKSIARDDSDDLLTLLYETLRNSLTTE